MKEDKMKHSLTCYPISAILVCQFAKDPLDLCQHSSS